MAEGQAPTQQSPDPRQPWPRKGSSEAPGDGRGRQEAESVGFSSKAGVRGGQREMVILRRTGEIKGAGPGAGGRPPVD